MRNLEKRAGVNFLDSYCYIRKLSKSLYVRRKVCGANRILTGHHVS